jgi:hypothetical protein
LKSIDQPKPFCDTTENTMAQITESATSAAKCGQPGLVNDTTRSQIHLTDPRYAAHWQSVQKQLREDPEFGRGLLRKAGIITSDGKIAEAFGGED